MFAWVIISRHCADLSKILHINKKLMFRTILYSQEWPLINTNRRPFQSEHLIFSTLCCSACGPRTAFHGQHFTDSISQHHHHHHLVGVGSEIHTQTPSKFRPSILATGSLDHNVWFLGLFLLKCNGSPVYFIGC
jgi:hypothetical protein